MRSSANGLSDQVVNLRDMGSTPILRANKYWILFEYHECPICGRGQTYRERIYDKPKPLNPSERHVWVPDYDWCDAL